MKNIWILVAIGAAIWWFTQKKANGGSTAGNAANPGMIGAGEGQY